MKKVVVFEPGVELPAPNLMAVETKSRSCALNDRFAWADCGLGRKQGHPCLR
jgi:hypothetical protein